MSQEIREYILNNYEEFKSAEIDSQTDYPYAEIPETIDELEKEGKIEWRANQRKYIVQISLENNSETNEVALRDFESKKAELKKFADSVPNNIKLESLVDTGVFLPAKAKVTDVNEITEKIQGALVEQNNHLKELYKAFNKVYETFNGLDKDYIQRILVNLEATKEANKKAVQGLEENKKIVKGQQTIIEVLKKHKTELDSLQHLKEIDAFYDDYIDFKTSQEETTKDLYSNQGLVADKITMLSEEYGMFKASQENSIADLRSMQEIAEGELVLIQEGYDGILKKEDSNLVETKNLQEQLSKNIKYLWAGFILNFAIVIILFVLIVSGVV
ncbi:hypothetical protein ABZ559_01835 [Streptococcus sp. ZY19097]|uniref:hypothetical protein n=1 Tax=Streptococcus sp. ZY19097 TaxID=3231906 RepID=UPI003458D35F